MAHHNCPKGWFAAGSDPADFDMELVDDVSFESKPVVRMRGVNKDCEGFGTMMQVCKSDRYRGQRLRLSAAVRSENLDGWAGLWFRVDPRQQAPSLAFDNMQDRAIKGTTDWTRHSIVLDVAEESFHLAFGALMSGMGSLWLAEFRLERVGLDVPSTSMKDIAHRYSELPVNLDFSETE